MTGKELEDGLRAIYARARDEAKALVKGQKYKVFMDSYAFHRYVKYGEPNAVAGDAALKDLITHCGRLTVTLASPEAIKREREKIRLSEIADCKRSIQYGKTLIIENEEKLMKLKGTKR